MAHLCPSPPLTILHHSLIYNINNILYCSCWSDLSLPVQWKVFADGCDSTNLFSQFGLFTIVAHLQYNHLHAVRGSMQHVTSASCWHTATAFHLLIIITFTFTRLWEETRSKFPSFTSGSFHVTIPTCSKASSATLHIGNQLEHPLHILPTCALLHLEIGTSQKYVASSSIKKVNEVVDLLI